MQSLTDGSKGDIIVILSSEYIASVMEMHFNRDVYKKSVKVIDAEPVAHGYAFTLDITDKKASITTADDKKRDRKGRFTKDASSRDQKPIGQ